MGCSSSTTATEEPSLTEEQATRLLSDFLRLQREIALEESAPPMPCLTQTMMKLEWLKSELEELETAVILSDQSLDPFPLAVGELRQTTRQVSDEDQSIYKVARELKIAKNPDSAIEHEEFIANMNRKIIAKKRLSWLNKKKDEAEAEIGHQTDRIHRLKSLYEERERLLGPQEEEIDKLKRYRETLFSGAYSWIEALKEVTEAASHSGAAAESWRGIGHSKDLTERMTLATSTRDQLLLTIFSLRSAQNLLEGVQMPYCTRREVNSLMQVVEYIYSDMHIEDRYRHAEVLYSTFHKRLSSLKQWVTKTLSESLYKEMDETDKRLAEVEATFNAQVLDAIGQNSTTEIFRVSLKRDEGADFSPQMPEPISFRS